MLKKKEKPVTGVILNPGRRWEVMYKGLSFGSSSDMMESVEKLDTLYKLDGNNVSLHKIANDLTL